MSNKLENIISVKDIKGHYITNAYGVKRIVKAVDGISLNIKKG